MADASRAFRFSWLVVVFTLVSPISAMGQMPPPPGTKLPELPSPPTPPGGGGPESIPPLKIKPKTPVSKLLPKAPGTVPDATKFVTSLGDVPQIGLEKQFPKKQRTLSKVLTHQHHMVTKILYVNKKDQDGYLKALIQQRKDLQGVPFLMGEKCRLAKECWGSFQVCRRSIHAALNAAVSLSYPARDISRKKPGDMKRLAATQMWSGFDAFLTQDSHVGFKTDPAAQKTHASILMQILAPECKEFKEGLIANLSQIPHVHATKSLAHLAVFAEAKETRQRAMKALQLRRERHYTKVLERGLDYPWPEVARNATEAIVALDRKDMVPQLIAMLEKNDPRIPLESNKGQFQVRHLVKLLHNQNCLLCHPPVHQNVPTNMAAARFGRTTVGGFVVGRTDHRLSSTGLETNEPRFQAAIPESARTQAISTAPTTTPNQTQVVQEQVVSMQQPDSDMPMSQVPIPGQEMPSASGQYGSQHHHVAVRLDVTYLRPDFSRMEKAKDVAPWPELQRFDYLVRRAAISKQAAKKLSAQIRKSYESGLSPYQRYAHAALRTLTGKNLPPDAKAWRKACKVARQ